MTKAQKQLLIWSLQQSLHFLKYNARKSGFTPEQVRLQIVDLKHLIKTLKEKL